ncbi:MAG: FMN-binding protein [Spirochaetales bacterium]|nr:FMN-binding protein [Spirochaetales bacterium]
MKKDGIVYTVIFTFIVSFVFVGILAGVNSVTAEQTARNQKLAFQRAVLNALHIKYKDNQEIFDLYQRDIKKSSRSTGNVVLYEYTNENEIFYIKEFSGQALWGTVTGVLVVDQEVDRIVGLDIISHNETPGLGGRIDEAWYKNQFDGELLSPEGKISVGPGGSGDTDHQNHKVDGITGASRTSSLMGIMINAQLDIFKSMLKGGSK